MLEPNQTYQKWLAAQYFGESQFNPNFPTTVESALDYITTLTKNMSVSATIARNRFLANVIKLAPRLAIEKNIIIDNLPTLYSPGIGDVIQKADEVEQCEDPRLNPKIFKLDNQRLDFIYKVDMNKLPPTEQGLNEVKITEKRENEFINEAKDQILFHVKAQYEHYSGGEWDDLSDLQKKMFLQEMVIVGSDNGRVLGIGDWGKNAGITAGKNLCYFAGAKGAFSPEQLMGIGFDVGTDRENLQNNHFYKGTRKNRQKNYNYYRFMHLMLRAIDRVGIGTFQFEDFQGVQAWRLLDWARKNLEHTIVFNDDIEGTAAMAMNALYVAKNMGIDLTDSLFIIDGVGGAGSGISKQTLNKLRRDMKEAGIPDEEIEAKIKKKVIYKDRYGLLYKGQTHSKFTKFQKGMHLMLEDDATLKELKIFMLNKKTSERTEEKARKGKAQKAWKWGEEIKIEEYMEFLRAKQKKGEKLLGKDGKGSVFIIATTTKAGGISTTLMRHTSQIIKKDSPEKEVFILGLSNPTQFTDFLTTDESERYTAESASKEDRDRILTGAIKRVYDIFKGKVRIATGTRFPDVYVKGGRVIIGQGNNVFIFPGVGLGLSMAGVSMEDLKLKGVSANMLWDDLWLTATETLFEWYSNNPEQKKRLKAGVLMPAPSDIPQVTLAIATKVADKIRRLAEREDPGDLKGEYNSRVSQFMYRKESSEQSIIRTAIALTEDMIEHINHLKHTRPNIPDGDLLLS